MQSDVDGWTDRKGRTLLNFLVQCPKGTMFIKSVDASTHVKDTTLLCELMDGFIQEIGLQHVVQIIIDNVANICGCWQVANGEAPHIVLDSLCCPLHSFDA